MSFLKIRLVATAVALVLVSSVVAETASPSGTPAPGVTLVPRDVYVGDTAELTFEVTLTRSALAAGETLEINTDLLSPSRDVTVLSATVTARSGRAEVRVRFVPWVSGPLELPSLPVGEETVSPPSPVIASLIRDPATGLEGPRSPILVPGTSWILYGFLAGALAFLLLVAFCFSRFRRYAFSGPSSRNSARRKRAFLRDLSALSRRTGKLSQDVWYALFSASLRRYLGLYAFGNGRASLSCTGRELAEITERRRAEEIGEIADADETDAIPGAVAAEDASRAGDIVRALFEAADRVRFSGHECEDARARDVELARALCRVLEEDGPHAVP